MADPVIKKIAKNVGKDTALISKLKKDDCVAKDKYINSPLGVGIKDLKGITFKNIVDGFTGKDKNIDISNLPYPEDIKQTIARLTENAIFKFSSERYKDLGMFVGALNDVVIDDGLSNVT